MEKIRRIINLYEQSTTKSTRYISKISGCSRTAVDTVIKRLNEISIGVDAINKMSDDELSKLIYTEKAIPQPKDSPDFEYYAKELSKRHVNKMMLWREYITQHPNGYKSTQFIELLNKHLNKHNYTVHIERKCGEKMYVDWAGDPSYIYDEKTGEQIRVYLFVTALGYSNYPYVEAFLNTKQDSFIMGHVNAFKYYGRLPLILVPDNDKAAVIKANKYDPTINIAYQKMADYYNLGILPTRVRKPKDKPTVENAVYNAAEREVIGGLRNKKYYSLKELNDDILKQLEAFSNRPFQKREGSRKSVFLEFDYPKMRELPTQDYSYAEYKKATVNIDYHIEIERNFYSVPYTLLSQKVDVEIHYDTIKVFYKNVQVALHPRIINKKYTYSTKKCHMPEKHSKMGDMNKDYFLNWASQYGNEAVKLVAFQFERHLIEEQAFRQCQGILRLAKVHGRDLFIKCCKDLVSFNATYQDLKRSIESSNCVSSNEDKIVQHNNIRGPKNYA